jgi:hypothetical protein
MQLNSTLYRVHRHPLQQASNAFAPIFTLGNKGVAEGTAGVDPIVIGFVPQ